MIPNIVSEKRLTIGDLEVPFNLLISLPADIKDRALRGAALAWAAQTDSRQTLHTARHTHDMESPDRACGHPGRYVAILVGCGREECEQAQNKGDVRDLPFQSGCYHTVAAAAPLRRSGIGGRGGGRIRERDCRLAYGHCHHSCRRGALHTSRRRLLQPD